MLPLLLASHAVPRHGGAARQPTAAISGVRVP